MRCRSIILLILLVASCGGADNLRKTIAEDIRLDRVDSLAHAVAQSGFNAGSGYNEVWIRDFNTFIDLSLDVMDASEVEEALSLFFDFQGPEGDIPDGYVPVTQESDSYDFRRVDSHPDYQAHKNDVETDQETSLVQAVYKYVKYTGDSAFLMKEFSGMTVLERLEYAMDYLMNYRYNKEYGLLWGATTADWGDVQPEHEWGVYITDDSHPCIDIYDNAMFVIALADLVDMAMNVDNAGMAGHWSDVRQSIVKNIRTHLWDTEKSKFRPHIYLAGSPFPEDFDEDAISYHGGPAVAAKAGILTREEVKALNGRMLADVEASGAQSIGLTLYPVYPDGFFKNHIMKEYSYQNGGDWTWFGAQMISALIDYGFVQEAYDEVLPMIERVIENDGFHEWYRLDGTPMGSSTFRGAAGVLHTVIAQLREY